MELSQNALAKESIAYRFESQSSIDDAKEQRDKEWKEAYERLGQEPPPRPEEPVDDGKTLYEEKNTLEWDEKMKLGNQWRGLGPEELKFLADKAKEKRDAEKVIEDQEKRELAEYRERLAAKHANAPAPAPPGSSARKLPPKAAKKDVKSLMKGIVVKKKPAASTTKPTTSTTSTPAAPTSDGVRTDEGSTSGTKRAVDEADTAPADKKAKVD